MSNNRKINRNPNQSHYSQNGAGHSQSNAGQNQNYKQNHAPRRRKRPRKRSNAPLLVLCLLLVFVCGAGIIYVAKTSGNGNLANSANSGNSANASSASQPTPVPTATAPIATATPEPTAVATPTASPTPTPEPTPVAPVIEQIDGATYVDGILIANKTYALSSSYNPGGLTAETQAAFNQLASAASAEGLNIYVSSGFRSYERQATIYQNYVARDGQLAADTYSARPGHSEHQTGLAFDLNSIDESFTHTAEGQWVAQNAHNYGFIIRFPEGKEDKTGYMYESWHLRYLGQPLATKVYESDLCLEEYLGITSEYQS